MNPEHALLGAVLQGFPVAEINLTGADFDSPTLGELWALCQRRATAGEPVDPVTLRDHIGTIRGLQPMVLVDCINQCPLPANAPWYAQQIAEAATRRGLRNLGIRVQQLADESDRPAGDLIEDVRTHLDRLPSHRASATRSIGDLVPSLIDHIDRGAVSGTPTPWPDLDQLIRGWQPGRLYVVGARPGVGKSILGVDAALTTAGRGEAVFMASAEMPEDELGMRMVANLSRVSLSTMLGTKTEADWSKISTATARLAEMPIEIDDSSHQSLATIRQRCSDIRRRRTLGLVVVDYLQLLTPTNSKAQRQEQVNDLSRGLKVIAREMEVPVIALAQLNRANTARSDKTPVLTDLRESGGIEADADVVILLHRDEPPLDAEMTVLVAKNRGGPKGRFPLQVYGHQSRLADPTLYR